MNCRTLLYSAIVAAILAGSAQAQSAAVSATLDRILPEIRTQYPGRLSDATQRIGPDGRTYYRIKWLTPEGRIIFLEADAETGRHREVSGDSWER